MSDRTPSARLRDALKHLVIARQADADPAVALVYLRGLEDLEVSVVERVCEAIGKEPRELYTPALPELGALRARCEQLAREDADRAAAARLLPMPPQGSDADPRTWVFCSDCRDEASGYRGFFCQGAGDQRDTSRPPTDATTAVYPCARRMPHRPHGYVDRCQCFGTNPVVAKRREAAQRRSTEAA